MVIIHIPMFSLSHFHSKSIFYSEYKFVTWSLSNVTQSFSFSLLLFHFTLPLFTVSNYFYLLSLWPYHVETPVPIWTWNLSNIKSIQYLDGQLLGNTRCCKHVYAGSVMDNSSEMEIRVLSYNSSWVRFIHLNPNILGKGMNPALFLPAMG